MKGLVFQENDKSLPVGNPGGLDALLDGAEKVDLLLPGMVLVGGPEMGAVSRAKEILLQLCHFASGSVEEDVGGGKGVACGVKVGERLVHCSERVRVN